MGGRILSQLIHHLRDLSGAVDSLQGDGVEAFLIIAVLLIQLHHLIPQGLSVLLAPCGHLAQAHHRHHGVLVPRVGSGQAAVAFLQAEHIVVAAGLLEQLDLLSDIFEAGQHLDQLHVVIRGDRIRHVGGHDGLYHSRILRHGSRRRSLSQNIFRDQHAGHVSGEGNVLAGLRIQRIDAQTVRIRIGGHHDVRVLFLRQLQRQGEGLGILRIGIVQRGERGIRKLLLGNHVYMLEAELGKHAPYRLVSGAVEGRVDDADVVRHLPDHLGMDDLLLQLHHVGVVDLGTDHLIQPFLHGLFLRHGLHGMIIRHRLHLGDDLLILGGGHLRAVLPVYLIAVVLRRIVAGRHNDTGDAAQGTQREGKLRSGAKLVEHVCLNPVRRQAQRRLIREFRGHIAGIVGDGDALLFSALLDDIIGQSLGGLPHRVDVHPVGARADHAAQSSGSELQLLIEPVLDLLLIALDSGKLVLRLLIKIRILPPEAVLVHIAHFLLHFRRRTAAFHSVRRIAKRFFQESALRFPSLLSYYKFSDA